MTTIRTIGAFALAAAALAACGPRTEPEAPPSPTIEFKAAGPAETWICADGQTLSVTFQSEPAAVEIGTADGAQLMLPPVAAESGARYESEIRFFHVASDTAVWKNADLAETTCAKP
jgi:membrane-bound inhibitor of C-type lysozyme